MSRGHVKALLVVFWAAPILLAVGLILRLLLLPIYALYFVGLVAEWIGHYVERGMSRVWRRVGEPIFDYAERLAREE